MPNTARRCALAAIAVVAAFATALPASSQQVRRAASPAEVEVRLSDARTIEPNSVRFSAAQLARSAPVVVLFGATTPSWHRARSAIQQAIFEGYPVAGVLMGPTGEAPSLEIYAHGQLVTNPINLNQITQAEMTELIRDIWREHYAR